MCRSNDRLNFTPALKRIASLFAVTKARIAEKGATEVKKEKKFLAFCDKNTTRVKKSGIQTALLAYNFLLLVEFLKYL